MKAFVAALATTFTYDPAKIKNFDCSNGTLGKILPGRKSFTHHSSESSLILYQVDLVVEHNHLERNVKRLVDEDFPSLILDNQKKIETVGKHSL